MELVKVFLNRLLLQHWKLRNFELLRWHLIMSAGTTLERLELLLMTVSSSSLEVKWKWRAVSRPLQQRILNFFQSTTQNVIFTRNTKTHVLVMIVAVSEGTSRDPSHAFAYQHLVKVYCITVAIRDPRPYIEGRSGVINLEAGLVQRSHSRASLIYELVTQCGVVIRVRHQHLSKCKLQWGRRTDVKDVVG